MDRAAHSLRVRYDRESLPDAGDGADDFDTLDTAAPGPHLFVHAIKTLAAPPWEQAAAARLEARLNAPLPLDQVKFVLRRLTPWKPGAAGDYAAIYARHDEVREGLVSTAFLDGKPIAVVFPAPGRLRNQTRVLGTAVALSGLGVFLAILTIASVLTARAEATARLELLEQTVARRAREAARLEAANARLQAIEAIGLSERRAMVAVADLDWAAAARTPTARIESLIKADDILAAEVRGQEAPFEGLDRKVSRYEKPIRRGVWLWTIEDLSGGAG